MIVFLFDVSLGRILRMVFFVIVNIKFLFFLFRFIIIFLVVFFRLGFKVEFLNFLIWFWKLFVVFFEDVLDDIVFDGGVLVGFGEFVFCFK